LFDLYRFEFFGEVFAHEVAPRCRLIDLYMKFVIHNRATISAKNVLNFCEEHLKMRTLLKKETTN
jgi:hypothetical protein